MLHLPLLRGGKPYRSLNTLSLKDMRSGEAMAEMSLANPGLIARDLAQTKATATKLQSSISTAELLQICRDAANLFATGEVSLGETTQNPDQYLASLAATTGMPVAMGRNNMGKIEFVLREMERVLAGLTRDLPLETLDQGWNDTGGRMVSFRRNTDVLAAVLPSNSPGVHSLWIPAIALKIPLALKPGRQEPWTPMRISQALIAAGLPPEMIGLYPTTHAGAAELLLRSGRSLLFGDKSTVAPWVSDPGVQLHGPGWSKVFFGADQTDSALDHVAMVAESVAINGGRSCVNASGVWMSSQGRQFGLALAEQLAQIRARGLEDPEAQLAAFPSVAAAEAVSSYIDARIAEGRAEDLTAKFRSTGRVEEVDRCAFMLPTVLYTDDPNHSLAQTELLFPLVTVVEAPQEELLAAFSETLVLTLISEDRALIDRFSHDRHVDRLNLGPVPTSRVSWDQPHEGNLFNHLYEQRALQFAQPGCSA